MVESSFPFIVSNGPKLQNDPNIRKLIRKQAMRDVGLTRKKRGNHGQVDLRQISTFDGNTDSPVESVASFSDSSRSGSEQLDEGSAGSSSSSTDATEYNDPVDETVPTLTIAKRASPLEIASPFSFTAINLFSHYETARSKFQVDVSDLAVLTNFNVGQSTIQMLAQDSTRLAALLGHQQWSFLQFVPRRYGHSECLTAATNCLLAKVKEQLTSPPEKCREITLRLYTKALQTLQAAISSEVCIDADILAAMQILSLHELLDPSRDAAWNHHISGSARLIKYRTHKRFNSEFEKALLAAHVGPIVSKCLFENTHCYLESPEWCNLYLSLAEETGFLTTRSPLAIRLRMQMFKVPGIWHDIGEAVAGPKLFDDSELMLLETRCREIHDGFLNCMEDYKSHCVKMSLLTPPPEEIAMRRELFGTVLEGLAIVKRLLSTVCEAMRLRLESETQAIAHLMFDIQKGPAPKYSWLFSGIELGIASVLLLTKEQWEEDVSDEMPSDIRMASRIRYTTWNNALRTIH